MTGKGQEKTCNNGQVLYLDLGGGVCVCVRERERELIVMFTEDLYNLLCVCYNLITYILKIQSVVVEITLYSEPPTSYCSHLSCLCFLREVFPDHS